MFEPENHNSLIYLVIQAFLKLPCLLLLIWNQVLGKHDNSTNLAVYWSMIMFPCTKLANSLVLASLIYFGKKHSKEYFLKNWGQSIESSLPSTSLIVLSVIHRRLAQPISLNVEYNTLCSSMHLRTRSISSISWIQSSAKIVSPLQSKEGGCILLKFSTVHPSKIMLQLRPGSLCAISSITCCATSRITSYVLELGSASKFDPNRSKDYEHDDEVASWNLDSIGKKLDSNQLGMGMEVNTYIINNNDK